MAKGSFRCTKCDRSFSMAAHLQRHLNTIHGAKRGRPSAARTRPGARRRGRPPGRSSRVARRTRAVGLGVGGLGAVSRTVIQGIRALQGRLIAQRSQLDAQIGAFTQAMETLGVAAPKRAARRARRGPGRPKGSTGRAGSLREFIVRVLRRSSAPLSPRDIGRGVKKAGFRTKAKDITRAVSNTLPKIQGIRRVGFGQYKLAG